METKPVTAKSRRVFEPMEPSDSNVMVPICPSESTWVPPQNSSEAGPACTTRTDEPYLSPKKAMAPMPSASSRDVSVVSTSMPVNTARLARAKTSSSSSRLGCSWWEKSKRRYSGETSDPCWRTWSPSTARSDACSRCVAVWLRRMASRRSPSMVASASCPARTSPVTRARCATSPGTALTVSRTSATPDSVTMVPVSPTCPPLSA